MRRIASTAMILATSMIATPVLAGSISTVTGIAASQPSVLEIDCAHCPAPVVKASKSDYQVPSVPSGSQTAEVVDVNGEKKLKRVESWLGGSPVVVYTSASGWATDGSAIVAGALPLQNEIDHDATTAAVDAPQDEKPAPALAGFELRLN
ncbi:MAG: plant virulence effector HPE1-like domain-containing protein [Rhizobium rhizophilum]|uniref:plant virulence effector HPE1-like domain-containing protein n=1 Tax=Rhizobium rhizophilum TaxID=1850373 RepID=UPI003918D6B5